VRLKVKHLHIKTPNVQKSVKFWVDNLGATIKADRGTEYALDLHGVTLVVSPLEETQARIQRFGLEHIAIGTDELTNLVTKLESNGARILEKTDKGVYFMETPEGVQLQLYSKLD
jgi:catechol 2,3-dioxygenase-like lactoylglutathione lyase family enzyme